MTFSKIFSLISFVLLSVCGFGEESSPKVVVIGAGLAGLTTAYRLQQKGIDVHVYEARNRVGGRVLSAYAGGNIIELGGQNITDGGKAENMRRLIDVFDLELIERRADLAWGYFSEENLISQSFLDQSASDPEQLKLELIESAQKCKNMKEVFDDIFKDQDLLYKTLSTRLAGYEGGSIEKLSSFYVETLYYMLLGGLSAAHQDAEHHIDLLSIKGGNSLLAEKLAETLGKRVHLNMPLTAVSKDEKGLYHLAFENGEMTTAEILVLAIPCSTYEEIVFDETLFPEGRLEAIQNVQYGTNAKIIIPASLTSVPKPTCINDRAGCFLDSIHNSVILYYTKEAGRFSAETIQETYDQERAMVEAGFKDLGLSQLDPVFAQDAAWGSYEGPVGYSWPNDPYVKGSYSYIAAGQEEVFTAIEEQGEEEVKTLFAPIDHLYFAGEHASILIDVAGTMEAAVESGGRTARMIETALQEG